MANGILGSMVLPDTNMNLVAVITGKCFWAEIDILILNPTVSDITVQIAISPSSVSSPNPDDYCEKGGVAASDGGVIEHEDKIVDPGSKIFVKGSAPGLVVQVRGKAITKR